MLDTSTWTDISVEAYREYDFGNGNKTRIDEPVKLLVSASGGHRVTDAAGRGHYIPAGYIHIMWEPKAGQPIFVA